MPTIDRQKERTNLLWGSLAVAFGSFLFATNDAIFKLSGYKESELLTGRFLVQWIWAISWWIYKHPKTATHWYGDSPYIFNVWIRGFLYIFHIFTLWYAMALLPIGDANCILYQSPLVIVFLAAIWLREPLPVWYILTPTTIACVSGILLISQPKFLTSYIFHSDSEPLNVNGLIAIVTSMISWSFVNLLVRTALKSHFLQLEMVSSVQVLFLGLPIIEIMNHLFFKDDVIGDVFSEGGWNLDYKAFLYMILLGTSGFVALICMVVGYQWGDATKVPWLEYTNVITSMIYQAVIFNDIPNVYEGIGGALVLCGSVVPLIHELCYKKDGTESYEEVQLVSSNDDEYLSNDEDDHQLL
eukprot:348371_1